MPTNEQDGATSSDTLQGWKDIAGYFGRSVRSVQRWEREFGLPVHRIRAADGQTVYAIRAEIEEWRKSRDLPKPLPEDEEASTNGHAEAHPTDNSSSHAGSASGHPATRRAWQWAGAALIAALLIVLGITIGTFLIQPRTGPVASIYASGTNVVAYDALGRLVWSHNFGRAVSYTNADPGSFDLRFAQDPARTGPQAIIALRFAAAGLRSAESDALVAFDQRGNVLWTFQPDSALHCGDKVFAGPWRIYSVSSSTGPGPLRVWAAFNDPTNWPGLLMEIDARGHQRIRMISTGWIRGVAEWKTSGGSFLAVSGVNNERDLPSLSLIDLDAEPAMSPHTDPRFSCETAPSSTPRHVYLFPPLDTGPRNYAFAGAITVLGTGLKLQVNSSDARANLELGENLSLRSFTFPEDYWAVHRDKEAAGIIRHPTDACPERTRPQPIEEWTADKGWTHSTIAPTVQNTIGRK